MAKISISQVKSRFESGDRPTGQDFVDLIDTLAAQATDLASFGTNEQIVPAIENNTELDRVPISEWRLLKYMVSLSKTTNGDSKFYATEFSILIDGTNLNVSEYGIIDSDGDIGTVEVSGNGTHVILTVIPNPSVRPITARFARVGLKS